MKQDVVAIQDDYNDFTQFKDKIISTLEDERKGVLGRISHIVTRQQQFEDKLIHIEEELKVYQQCKLKKKYVTHVDYPIARENPKIISSQ